MTCASDTEEIGGAMEAQPGVPQLGRLLHIQMKWKQTYRNVMRKMYRSNQCSGREEINVSVIVRTGDGRIGRMARQKYRRSAFADSAEKYIKRPTTGPEHHQYAIIIRFYMHTYRRATGKLCVSAWDCR